MTTKKNSKNWTVQKTYFIEVLWTKLSKQSVTTHDLKIFGINKSIWYF